MDSDDGQKVPRRLPNKKRPFPPPTLAYGADITAVATTEQLAKAFLIWEKQVKENPDEFDIDKTGYKTLEDRAYAQAEHLISLL